MATKEELLQEVKDAKDRVKAEAAYDAADKTEPNPMPPSGKTKKFAKGGAAKAAKYMTFSETGKPAGMKPVTKMASGGMTASSRADGIAQKGKTRGKVC